MLYEERENLLLVKRLIKNQIYTKVCQEHLAAGQDPRIWEPMLLLATDFRQEVEKEWLQYLQTHSVPPELALLALVTARSDALQMYERQAADATGIDMALVRSTIDQFVADFNPSVIVNPIGVS